MDASILVPAGAALLPMLLIFALIEAVRYAEGLRRTRSPFNRDFLRPAGFSLQRRLEELQLELALSFGFGLFVPLWFYSMWLSVQNWNPDAATTSLLVLFAVAGGGGFLVLLLRTFRNYRGLRLLRMGLDGELATGQELDRLMRHGCRIFHDVPAGPGNIDHVVVGPAGILAVETKSRRRADRGRGAEDATVNYDGHRLRFPDEAQTAYLDQAGRQARWLGEWLSRTLGEEVAVQPVLALPGWFVDRRGSGQVAVVNPKEAAKLIQGPVVLDRRRQERISFRLERSCRAMTPRNRRPAE
ncbi:MAG: nuclease-related domain-containing protein [Gammaproteobacteria bacterium]|jgi:hypothetical protein